MVRRYISLIVFLIGLSCNAQRVTYEYDSVGNRIRRQIVSLQSANNRTNNSSARMGESIDDRIEVSFGKDTNTLIVSFSNFKDSESKLTLSDINGKQLLKKNLVSESTTIDMGNIPSGIYLINITYNNQTKSWKIIK